MRIPRGHANYLEPVPTNYGKACNAENDGYHCSRPLGHDGDHAARGINDDQFLRWSRTAPGPADPETT